MLGEEKMGGSKGTVASSPHRAKSPSVKVTHRFLFILPKDVRKKVFLFFHENVLNCFPVILGAYP